MNTFGQYFRITTFGESHGGKIGVVIDGCPAGLTINKEAIQLALDRRKPGQSALASARKESDTVAIEAGVYDGVTTGAPIALLIPNEDARSQDYAAIEQAYRPSHADYTYQTKYGVRDHRGGGRSSARETATRVAAGAIAAQLIALQGMEVLAWVSGVGEVGMEELPSLAELKERYMNDVRCPNVAKAAEMEARIKEVKKAGDTVGGVVSCLVRGVPAGLGSPIYGKAQALLGAAMLGINAVKGFEIGSGFAGAMGLGSEQNDVFYTDEDGSVQTRTNNSGGVQGGITNGQDIYFRVAFKPVSTIMQAQETVNADGEMVTLEPKGRHDPCVVPRAVPIVEAMAALVMADLLLAARLDRI